MPEVPHPVSTPDYLAELPLNTRVTIVRLRSLGDCVLTTPAIALLKAQRPDLEIAVVVEDRFQGVFEDNPDIAALLAPEVGAVRAWGATLAINFHGGTRSVKLMAASGARLRAGFAHHSGSFVYNIKIPRAQEILGEERPVHTAEHLASAMFWMGVPRAEIPRAKLIAPDIALGAAPERGPYAVMHPFASAPEKAWSVDGFLHVANYLREQAGLSVDIVAGPDDDIAPFQAAGLPAFRNAPLSEIKTLMAGAQLFVGNDSGPAHIAAAFGVPGIVLFGPSNPVTWAPWRTAARVLTSPEEDGGMASIDTGRVIAAVESLRNESGSERSAAQPAGANQTSDPVGGVQ